MVLFLVLFFSFVLVLIFLFVFRAKEDDLILLKVKIDDFVFSDFRIRNFLESLADFYLSLPWYYKLSKNKKGVFSFELVSVCGEVFFLIGVPKYIKNQIFSELNNYGDVVVFSKVEDYVPDDVGRLGDRKIWAGEFDVVDDFESQYDTGFANINPSFFEEISNFFSDMKDAEEAWFQIVFTPVKINNKISYFNTVYRCLYMADFGSYADDRIVKLIDVLRENNIYIGKKLCFCDDKTVDYFAKSQLKNKKILKNIFSAYKERAVVDISKQGYNLDIDQISELWKFFLLNRKLNNS